MNENCLKHVDFFTGFREKEGINKFNNFIGDVTNRDMSKLKKLEPKKLGIMDYFRFLIISIIFIYYICSYSDFAGNSNIRGIIYGILIGVNFLMVCLGFYYVPFHKNILLRGKLIAGDVVDVTFNKTTKTYVLKVEFINEKDKQKSEKHEIPKYLTSNFSEYIECREKRIDLLIYRNQTLMPLIEIFERCYACEKDWK